jgi:hypothetical protein
MLSSPRMYHSSSTRQICGTLYVIWRGMCSTAIQDQISLSHNVRCHATRVAGFYCIIHSHPIPLVYEVIHPVTRSPSSSGLGYSQLI